MLREIRTLVVNEERHPVENEVWDAWNFANEKHCIVELKWFIPHYGWKVWIIEPENQIEDLLKNLNIVKTAQPDGM